MNEYDETDPQKSWVSKMRKDNKELKAQVRELQDRLYRTESNAVEKDLSQLFMERGLDPRMIKFYNGQVTDEAVDYWIEENDELLFLRQREYASEESTVTATDQETWEFMRELTSARKQAMDIESRLREAENEEDLLKILEEAESIELPIMPF